MAPTSTVTTQAVIWKGGLDSGLPPLDHFQLQDVEVAELQEGEVLLDAIYISVDPYMRGRMRTSLDSYIPPFTAGEPLAGYAVAKVVQSKAPALPEGSYVAVHYDWQQRQVLKAEACSLINTKLLEEAKLPLSVYLGALGMTGFTAYASLERIGKPKAGETVFVSGAAGAVGLVVGQLCKNVYECTVVGSAGSDEKVALLKRYGYDAAFNYKKEATRDALKRLAPQGLDVYYDNVGGETLEAAMDAANPHARIVVCGSISQYNAADKDRYGVKNLFQAVSKRLLIHGFLQSDFTADRPEFESKMSAWLREGKVAHVEHVEGGGLPHAGQAFINMMGGGNIGKAMVQCSPDPFRK